MQKKEWLEIALVLKNTYPNFLSTESQLNTWYLLLQDQDARDVQQRAIAYSMTNHYPPTVSDLRAKEDDELWAEGWEEVCRAIRMYGAWRKDMAIASLSPKTRRVAEMMGFEELCNSDNRAVDRANFRMIYEQLQEREMKTALPETIVKLIGG